MEIKITTKHILLVLYILSWIIFVGVSIQAGGSIVAAVFALVKPEFVKNLWLWSQVDLSALFAFDQTQFFVILVMMSIVSVLKAIMFYLIIKVLHDRKISIAQPFSNTLRSFILNLSFLSFLIGIFCAWAVSYADGIVKQGVEMPMIQYLHLEGADVWLFMSVILFAIAHIIKRGIEIQNENELTI